MAYEKHNWSCGETVTAELLNHMEEGIEDAKGYECTETITPILEETVTTTTSQFGNVAEFSYSGSIAADTINVIFDGTEYTCEKEEYGGTYGATFNPDTYIFDWSNYPFTISSSDDGGTIHNRIITKDAGTHTVKISALSRSATVSECFRRAVQSLTNLIVTDTNETLDKTWLEIRDALASGVSVFIRNPNDTSNIQTVLRVGMDERKYIVIVPSGRYIATNHTDYPTYESLRIIGKNNELYQTNDK